MSATVKLSTGRSLDVGDEFTIAKHLRYSGHWGTGRYRVVKIRPNGEINAWGPIRNGNTPRGRFRTFKTGDIEVAHNKNTSRKEAKSE